ncbi:hypothetical protein KR222_002901 [Zaprionus bogoriensis]|nr:hypothetical protein KR222_002901 [Zaprionus bogoriensis]
MDIHRLIDEVHQRPALWDSSHPDHSNRLETKRLWESVAFSLAIRVDVCRSKWKNLRCSYRRLQKQQQSPATASPAPQWPYMKAMSFLDCRGGDVSDCCDVSLNASMKRSPISLKAEPTEEMELEADNEALMQEFQSMATPQALRRLSHNISLASAAAEEQAVAAVHQHQHQQQQGGTAVAAAAASSCQCAKRVDEQVDFLQSLEREEQQLMQSTSQDLARCKNVLHVGDSDYNFLISFLPLMKQMSPLQNVSFRAKMGELLLQTMQQPPMPHHIMHQQQQRPPQQQQQPQPMQQQQQQAQQQQHPIQQLQQPLPLPQSEQATPKQEQQPPASQMLLNQQQMALDQAQQVSTSSTSWN